MMEILRESSHLLFSLFPPNLTQPTWGLSYNWLVVQGLKTLRDVLSL